MPGHRVVFLFACVVCFLWGNQAWAGAWTQSQGQCYGKAWVMALVGGAAFDIDEGTFDTDSFQDVSLNHYVECGVTDKWTFIGTGRALGWAKYDDLSTIYSGRLSFALRRAILTGPVKMAAEVEYGYQGAVGSEDLARDSKVDFLYQPVVASQTARAGFSLGYGTSWGWLTAGTGLRLFTAHELSAAWVGMLQVGYKITENLLVDLHLPYNIQLESIDENNISGAGNTNYLGLGLGLSYWLSDSFGVNVGVDGIVFARANASTPAIQLGIEWK